MSPPTHGGQNTLRRCSGRQPTSGAEGIDNVETASVYRAPEFGIAYGVYMADGRLGGLLARAVVVVDEAGRVIHRELVPEIAQEPDYDAVTAAL